MHRTSHCFTNTVLVSASPAWPSCCWKNTGWENVGKGIWIAKPDFWWTINIWNYFQPARYVSFDPLQGFTLDQFSGKCPSCNYHFPPNDTVDGCEILHQLIGGKHPIIHRVSTIQDGAGFLPPNDMLWHVSSIRCFQMISDDPFIDTSDVSIGSTRIHPAAWWQLMSW